jgi:signal transduction histidine kinase
MGTRLFYALSLIVGVMVILYVDHRQGQEFHERLSIDQTRTGGLIAERLNSFIGRRMQWSVMAASVATARAQGAARERREIVREMMDRTPGVQWVCVTDRDLRVESGWGFSAEGPPTSLVGRAAVERALKDLGDAEVGAGFHRRRPDDALLAFVARMPDRERLLAMAFPLTASVLQPLLHDVGRDFAIEVVDGSGEIVTGNRVQVREPFLAFVVRVAGMAWQVRTGLAPSALNPLAMRHFVTWTVGLILLFGFLGFHFVVEQKKAELEEKNKILEVQTRKVREANERLVAANQELDDFTYVVSHDLKEPLRGIEAFSQILLEEHRDRLDGEAREYLETLVASSQRMKRLIEDLLKLSRIARKRYPYSAVAFGELVQEALGTLAFAIEQSGAEVVVAPDMPTVRCDRVRMAEVFQNLISNALKYRDKERRPRVEIGWRDADSDLVFHVKDNGIGIEEKYFDRIFQIFQRLHRPEEYEGTGAGLTVCKRIVEKHGGSIWVESRQGQGSTFFFSLPKQARG